MEAWRRRKNYDPMAAAGKKKEVSRKQSSSSLRSTGGKSPREANETMGLTSERKAPGSAPSSAVSRSSDSSGYLSREGGRGSRVGSAGASQSRTSTAPLRKLVHTASSSSLKNQSSRSSSSLTSREAEFQAWKRRKDYDPLAAARKSSSPAAGLRSNEAPGGGGGGGVPSRGRVGGKSAYSPSPTDRMRPIAKSRVSQSQSREMSQSLVVTSQGGLPLHRSSSFHQNQTSEDESGDDYSETAGDSSAHEGGSLRAHRNHFYLDDDELILPIGPNRSHGSQTRLQERALYGSTSLSPNLSPTKSRSKQLEALDNLVISTIFNVSSKLCASSSSVLRKTVALLPEQDEEQAGTVETILYLLEDVDMPTTPAKKTSRELSGTLRNLKKVEQALELLNKVVDLDEGGEEGPE